MAAEDQSRAGGRAVVAPSHRLPEAYSEPPGPERARYARPTADPFRAGRTRVRAEPRRRDGLHLYITVSTARSRLWEDGPMVSISTHVTPQRMWLSPEWRRWGYDSTSSMPLDRTSLERSYEIWSHARDRLTAKSTEFDRVDAITTLKRVVTQRIRALKTIYGFREMVVGEKLKTDLDVLSHLGIVRPLMLRQLIDLRNILEHEDGAPPDLEACSNLVEFVWYFLKSTDPLLVNRLIEVTFIPSDELWSQDLPVDLVEIGFGYPVPGLLHVSVRLAESAIITNPDPNYFEIIETGKRTKTYDGKMVILTGDIVGPKDLVQALWIDYFRGAIPPEF
jgi:hypothetical protein